MSREIKFRFWIKSEKRMDGPHDMWWNYIEFLNEDDCIVMQYTGLKDKNDKEIYEGDILTTDEESRYCPNENLVIEYSSDGFYYRTTKERFCLGHLYDLCYSNLGNYKYHHGASGIVIGNIYENPELLK